MAGSCLLALSLVYGCSPSAPAQEAITAERCQLLERLAWQWVPPYSQYVNGGQVTVPGHWHPRGAPCTICGDRTTRPGTALQANPGLTAPSPAPASPAAPPTPAAPQPQRTAPDARLAAELAGVSRHTTDLARRLERLEQIAAAHDTALDGLIGSVERNTRSVEQLGGAVEQLRGAVVQVGPRLDRVEKTPPPPDQHTVRGWIREHAGPLVAAAVRERLPAVAAPIVLQGLSLGGPIGLGLAAGGALAGRVIRQRRQRRASEPTAGGPEAPAPDPFPGAEHAAESAGDGRG